MADKSLTDLQEMQKLTSSMMGDYDSLLKNHGKVNKKLKEQVDIQKNILASIKDEKSARDAIEKLEKRYLALGTKKIDNNKNVIVALQMQNKIVREFLSATQLVVGAEKRRAAMLEKVNGHVQKVSGSMKHQVDHLKEELEKVPLLGKMFSKVIPFDKISGGIDRMGKAFSGGFKGAYLKTMKAGGTATQGMLNGLKGGLGGLSTSIARLGPMLAGPQAILAAMAAVIAVGVLRMYQIEKAAKEFKDSTGLLNNDMKDIQRQISKVSAEYAQIGVHAEDVAKYAAEFYNAFHGTQRASDLVVASMGVLEKNFGVAVGDQAKLNHLFQSSAHLSQEQAQYMTAQVVAAADLANVAPKKVIADMAENSEAMYQYFHGSVEEMGAAAVQAAKMGTSISQMTSMADKLLNFETSLTDELNAGAILGKNFNLSIARSAAAAGDLGGMYEAVVDAVGQQKDITKMTKFEQDAIVQATGMQISELANALHIKKKFSNASKEELAAGMELLKNGKNIHDINEDDLKTLVSKQKKQKEMQGQVEALGHMLHGFGELIMDAFLPVGQAFISILTPIVGALGSFIKGFISPIAQAFGRIGKTVSSTMEKFGGMEKVGKYLGKIFQVIGTLLGGPIAMVVEFLIGGITMVVDAISAVVSIFKGFATGDLKMVGEGFKDLASSVLTYFLRIPMSIFKGFLDMIPSLDEVFGGWITKTYDKIRGFFGFGKSDSGAAQEAASAEMQDGGSVNDGVIQNGKIVSTHPEDTIMAMKSPSDILGKAMSMSPLAMLADGIGNLIGGGSGGGSVDMGPLIAEIQGLRADMAAGKIAVHMDGRKVTSGITKISGQSAANSYVQR